MKDWAWPHPPTPWSDELLSSYLSRSALRYGLSPTRFCALHFPHAQVWTRDIDRSAPDAFCQRIAAKSGLTLDRVQEMTLRGVAQRITPAHPRALQATQRWVGALSVYHRDRRGHGLQFCPACLTDDGYFRRMWRMSYWTICPVHRARLLDACPGCGRPIMLHRHQVSLLRCHGCGRHLRRSSSTIGASDDADSAAVLALSERCQSACDRGSISIASQRLPADEFLAGAHFLVRLHGLWERQQQPGKARSRAPELEHCRVAERHRRLGRLAVMLSDWPRTFLGLADQEGATQQSLRAVGRPPGWIEAASQVLPAGIPHDRTKRGVDLRRRLRALHRQKREGWRTCRAELLLRAGGIR